MDRLPTGWEAAYSGWRKGASADLEEARWREAFQGYPRITFEDAPLTRLKKPLHEVTLAVISSGGVVLPGQKPFDADNPDGDPSVRWIEGCGPLPSWQIHHAHYDTTAAREDYNCVFPLDAVRQLAAEGVIGRSAPRQVSFMGYQPDPREFLSTSAPEIAEGLRQDAVDAVLLVPV